MSKNMELRAVEAMDRLLEEAADPSMTKEAVLEAVARIRRILTEPPRGGRARKSFPKAAPKGPLLSERTMENIAAISSNEPV